MLLSVVGSVGRLLGDLVLLRCRGSMAGDMELLAPRHEVRVLRRTTARPACRPGDRRLLVALNRCLPLADWQVLPGRPGTLLRWLRELAWFTGACMWHALGRRCCRGRQPLPGGVRELIVRLAAESPGGGYQPLRGALLALGALGFGDELSVLNVRGQWLISCSSCEKKREEV